MSAPQPDERGTLLRRMAERWFGAAPTHSARAPGRVNLIGEHIDYCDLAVLPIAIQRDVRIDFRPRDDARVRLANTDVAFEPCEFTAAESIAPAPAGHWSNYARAAAQHLTRKLGPLRGFDAVVDGDLPRAAGLSSSSALVVACALAALRASGRALPQLELAADCAEAERYVGTHSGGMDQAASLLGRAGCALRVEFAPLAVEAVPVPDSWRFAIADSLVVADKSGSLRAAYNARRSAAEAALRAVAALFPELPRPATYKALLASRGAGGALEVAQSVLDQELLRRFRHIVTESARVELAVAALRRGDAAAFGAAMDASQASLRDDCEVSTPELERLARLARRHGALGARLTGAGLGGALVALVDASRAEALLEGLAQDYFAERLPARELSRHLLLAQPSAGAS